ncbi:MAG: CoA pyrophosphatase [Deltaproteobacteria bacterium]|nr:CoA pyrophosphatase [Deltaproteobacteria bacterium]
MDAHADRFEILTTRTPKAIIGGDFRAAAVLAPIQERPDGDYLILTLRADNLSSHSGQVAFPGGSVDPGDDGPLATALRETEEEIGVDPGHVRIVGQLDQVFAGYNFLVTPFVGLIPYPYEFRPDPRETAEVFSVPVAALLRQEALTLDSRLSQRSEPIYHFQYQEWDIWGATARMVKQLLELVYGYEAKVSRPS